jgi:predicted nuclease of restriction endonuclease-like (RecB) superfamily
VENLARDLQREFPGIGGFSASNLWRMKIFFDTYVRREKLAPLVREIAWAHNIVIMEKCKDDLEREFYIRWTKKYGWSKNILIHQIESKAYERTFLNQTNFDKTLPEPVRAQAKLAVKDDYMFDFLELGDEYSERRLEQALLMRVDRFLREMGGMFAFVGNQFRLEVGGEEYYIDLLLYHRKLRCLVAVELKIGKFLPEHVGKMQFYLTALDNRVKEKGENPSIGLILCKSKNKTVVEYALLQSKKPIGVAAYRAVSALPRELKGQLPAPEQIQRLLDGSP